jgi:precorrin-2 dehydrogenase/sirohydrochlorin ferrochelatase
MAVFPLFIELKGRKCVLVGGGRVAARKAAVLAGFEAEILVISPELDAELAKLHEEGSLAVCRRKYGQGDLEGAFLAIAATNDPVVNREVVAEANRAGIFVNAADAPEECGFLFPAVVKRDRLVIGVSTSGSCPALSREIRKRLEKMVDGMDGAGLERVEKKRREAMDSTEDAAKRKKIIDAAVLEALEDTEDF